MKGKAVLKKLPRVRDNNCSFFCSCPYADPAKICKAPLPKQGIAKGRGVTAFFDRELKTGGSYFKNWLLAVESRLVMK